MTDSVAVLPPGFRVLDSAGAPVSGAKIRFFEASTTTPKEVFSDAALTVSLGSIVYTRSDGYPVASEGSSTTVLIYIDAGLYKIDILDADDVTLFPAKDNVQGAVDTSTFLTDADTTSVVIPVVALAANTSITTAYTGKLINASGAITLTLDAPATLGDGWNTRIRCNDATNPIKIVAASGTIKGAGFAVAGLALVGLGNTIELACDGANISICGQVPGRAIANGRIWTIADIVAAAPATTPGSFYIVGTAFGSFSVGDIIEATGQATFIGYTPPTNCGWRAWVQDENAPYQFQGSAWVNLIATTAQAQAGTDTVALINSATLRAAFKLASGNASGATLDLVLTSYAANYSSLIVCLWDLIPATDNVSLYMRSSTDGGSTYDAAASDYKYAGTQLGGTNTLTSTGAAQILIGVTVGNGAAEGCNAIVELLGRTNTALKAKFLYRSLTYNADDTMAALHGGGLRNAAGDVDALRFLFSSGNIASGKYAIYGLP